MFKFENKPFSGSVLGQPLRSVIAKYRTTVLNHCTPPEPSAVTQHCNLSVPEHSDVPSDVPRDGMTTNVPRYGVR